MLTTDVRYQISVNIRAIIRAVAEIEALVIENPDLVDLIPAEIDEWKNTALGIYDGIITAPA